MATTEGDVLKVKHLQAHFGGYHAVKDVSMNVRHNEVVAIIGPSGCGKSTYVRCLNRLHEEVAGAHVTGEVWLEGEDIYRQGADPVLIRRRVGMVFQKANPFPALSIYENVAVGPRLMGLKRRALLDQRVEQSLRQAALWDEVKDKLNKPGTSLSGGQQQRLCIARALAIQPPVILMDEPTSALDPISTARIEELVQELKNRVTVIIVTHNMQQASRISDKTAFFLLGSLVEYGPTTQVFTTPRDSRTEQYITGRFG